MPISKNRRKHKHHQYHPKAQPKGGQAAHATAKPSGRRSAVTIMVVLLAIFGFGIAFLSAGTNIPLLAGGTLLGAVTGYFIGQGMDRMAARSK